MKDFHFIMGQTIFLTKIMLCMEMTLLVMLQKFCYLMIAIWHYQINILIIIHPNIHQEFYHN